MPRILHIGVGNFFRAHQADYTQAAGWRVTGVSLRSPGIRDGLATQRFDYTLVIKDAGGTEMRVITCIDDVLVAPERPGAVVSAIASDDYDVITLTVTEKAYCLAPAGHLDVARKDVLDDLVSGPATVIGYLARGLAARHAPVTVLCCDNLPDNGAKLRAAVQSFARLAGLEISADVSFPSSMVDRITPATSDAIRTEASDPMAVPTEGFTEWVVEDAFAAARPNWPGVQWVNDVAPHEMRKLRMLNGAHSYLAYAGVLAGYEFVHEAVGDAALRKGAAALMAEAAETLPESVRGQAAGYGAALLERFDNPNLHHRLRQIAMDGSQKMPIRVVETMRARAGDSPALDAAVAAWIAFVRAEVATGRALDDPRAKDLVAACLGPEPEAALRAIVGA